MSARRLTLVVLDAPLNGELLRQRLVAGAKMRAAQQAAGASRRLAVRLRLLASGARAAQLAVMEKLK